MLRNRLKMAETALAKAKAAEAAANEALEKAKAEAYYPSQPPPLTAPKPPPLPPIAPKAAEPVRRPSIWGVPGERGPAPPPTVGYADKGQKDVPVDERSAARAAEGLQEMGGIDQKILSAIEKWYKENKGGTLTFGVFFDIAAKISDTYVKSLQKLVDQKNIIVRRPIIKQGKYNRITRKLDPDEITYVNLNKGGDIDLLRNRETKYDNGTKSYDNNVEITLTDKEMLQN
jgi:hypothetical protein